MKKHDLHISQNPEIFIILVVTTQTLKGFIQCNIFRNI